MQLMPLRKCASVLYFTSIFFFILLQAGNVLGNEKKLEDQTLSIEITEISDIKFSEDNAVKITFKILSASSFELEFSPDKIYLVMKDNNKISEWFFLKFFSKAYANLNKGDSLSKVGKKVGDGISWVRSFNLQPESTGTIVIPLEANISQEATLIFPDAKKSDVSNITIENFATEKIEN